MIKINYIGIVLNHQFPLRHTITLLDKESGRIDVVMRNGEVSAGMLLQYDLVSRMGRSFIEDIDILAVPTELIHTDFLFLHHVLELCFYFLPPSSCSDGIFDLLLRLYDQPMPYTALISKKFFLFKLLTIIGVYPELSPDLERLVIPLHVLSIDSAAHQSLDLECEQLLDHWLQRCVADHQKILQFKTIQFLTQNRLV